MVQRKRSKTGFFETFGRHLFISALRKGMNFPNIGVKKEQKRPKKPRLTYQLFERETVTGTCLNLICSLKLSIEITVIEIWLKFDWNYFWLKNYSVIILKVPITSFNWQVTVCSEAPLRFCVIMIYTVPELNFVTHSDLSVKIKDKIDRLKIVIDIRTSIDILRNSKPSVPENCFLKTPMETSTCCSV